ncbi:MULTISPECIES: bactofilin family protein [Uliginosibacterium]|uniref:Polymer-forming cytoskeletal protein n=1 Tax=Uliginosibacterium aquaticum TaxID=2731212 RepID=A0ABX2IEB1_9RHOO|nr:MULTISPECIES: polymer-forming cytoskeletal protein [Uliginosibacterium]MDO6385262.1 polymer-forming cytoskeletal protein [Uliginosibacterium sp. 31-12]NSL54994.1 polymer-forming cytoskeletal protein [Uliginosibacterium aquaticum]PLK47749.1 cell shape determination protein CcmA [Uliginosibacterium sp. TH139]
MFGKKKDSPIELTKLSSLIAGNMEVMGDVHFLDGLRVDGHIRGNVLPRSGAKSLLVLSDQGSIHGNVSAYDAVINGTIVGDLEVAHFLELQASARVTGNISYRQLRMDCGASVEGKLTRLGDAEDASNVVELAATAAGGSK